MEFIVNTLKLFKKQLLLVLIIFILTPISSSMADSKKMKTIAIIPFETNSQADISYITSGVLNMLYSRLSWKDRVTLIHKKDIKTSLAETEPLSETDLVLKIGENTQADYVVTGSITEFSNAFSLDVKIYDIKNRSYLTFYDQAEKIDQVVQKTDIISAKINKKVFDRTTTTFERIKRENLITEEELKRMNPEQMMPIHQTGDDENTPWWKFWEYL